MSRILLVDDEPMQHLFFNAVADELGHEFVSAHTLAEGKEIASSTSFDMVFLDVILPDGNGIDNVSFFKKTKGHPEVVVITSRGDLGGAEKTLKDGGSEYLLKPLSVDRIQLSIQETLRFRKHNIPMAAPTIRCDNILGGKSIERCKAQVAKAAASKVPVAIYGETGTGKELFARAVHDYSERANEPFVALDCASLAPNLIPSLLFGHVRGAFTGADRDRQGVVALAHKGTLFLDEVGELPLDQQASLLRVLETRKFRPVGGQFELESDFRLVTATNKDLEEMVEQGLFRSDLLYRLRGITITLPPLRERGNDLESLSKYRLHLIGADDKELSKDFISTLYEYEWPGNIRELFHTVDCAVATANDSPIIFARHLPIQIRVKATQASLEATPTKLDAGSVVFPTLKDYRKMMERDYVEKLLEHTGGNVKKAAETAGISRGYLYEMMKKCGIAR